MDDKDKIKAVIWEWCRDCEKNKGVQKQLDILEHRVTRNIQDINNRYNGMVKLLITQLCAVIGFLAYIIFK